MLRPFSPPEQHIPRLRRALLDWFAVNQRRLPWRVNYTPYEVWVSEVMLQQTQMERGVDYFNRWMARFPDIAALAAADEEAVLRQWEGLGYYSRARHLLAAARKIVAEHGGVFPSDLEAIRALPGVGPYTAGAIASIAFGEKLPCVDANVERVIARVFDVDSPVKQDPAAGVVRRWALRLVPEGRAREHNQAMMELGALICRKKPRCEVCPLAEFCISRHLGIAEQRPVPGKRAVIKPVQAVTGVLRRAGLFLCRSGRPPACGGNLWEDPRRPGGAGREPGSGRCARI
jgi:A/G-specific adenine glycosylase